MSVNSDGVCLDKPKVLRQSFLFCQLEVWLCFKPFNHIKDQIFSYWKLVVVLCSCQAMYNLEVLSDTKNVGICLRMERDNSASSVLWTDSRSELIL